MAKTWKHTFSKFYNWQTNDTFIPTGDKYLSSVGIDPVLHPRYLELAPAIFTNNTIATGADITKIVELPSFNNIYLGTWNIYYNTTSKSATVLGTTYQDCSFLYDTAWALKVFVFDATNIIRMNADLTTKESSVAHATGDVTAVLWIDNKILYAVGSIIYQVDYTSSISNAFSSTLPTFSALPYGSIVKKLYAFNGILYIFTTIGSNTIIYQAILNSSNVYEINYKHTVEWVILRDMDWNWGDMYWVWQQIGAISGSGLYQTSGVDSKKIQSVPFNSTVKCSFINSDYLAIIDWANYYRYGSSIPWLPKAFIKLLTHSVSFTAISSEYLTTVRSGWNVIQCGLWGNTYQNTGEIISMPYDAWTIWTEKNLDVLIMPYELKAGKTGASIQVQVQTNIMEFTNTWVNLVTINTLSDSVMLCRIDKLEILTALGSNNPDWQYMRFKVILNWWLPDWSSRSQYSPKVYQDIFISGEFINNADTYL